MSPRKPEAKTAKSKAAARKKLALSKETLKDLTARDRAKGVRGGISGGCGCGPDSYYYSERNCSF